MQDQNFVEFRWVVAVVRRWWWLIVGLGVLAAMLAVAYTSMQKPDYNASVSMIINPSKSSNSSQYTDIMAGQQLALTYSEMVKDQPVLEAAIQKLGLKTSPESLKKKMTVELVRNTQLIRLTVTDSSPKQAVVIANALAEAFAQHVQDLSSERYTSSIQDTKKQLDDLQAQINENQAKVDQLRKEQVTKDVALTDKRSLLTSLQGDYQMLMNNSQNLQLAMADITGRVYIVDRVQVRKNPITGYNSAVTTLSVSQQNADTSSAALAYGELMKKPALLDGVIKELGLALTANQLADQLSVDLVPGTQLVRLTVNDKDATKAQTIAQTVTSAFITQLKGLFAQPYADRIKSIQTQMDAKAQAIADTQAEITKLATESNQLGSDLSQLDTIIGELRSDYRVAQRAYEDAQASAMESMDAVAVTEPAQTPKATSSNRLLYASLAAVVGMVLGAALGFILKFADDRIQNSGDIRSGLDLPLLSTIGKITKSGNELVMNDAPSSYIAEDFRLLGNKLRFIKENAAIQTLLVTSPVQAEGKSLIVSNLAISLSRMGMRVVVVDADLHLPRLHQLFDLDQANGLTHSLSKGYTNGTLQSTQMGELKVITSGDLPPNPADILGSAHLTKVLDELKEKADIVLIDCPPVLAAVDTSILAAKVDGVLLVLRAGKSEIKAAREALEALKQVNANVVGLVLNAAPEREGYYRYYRKAEIKK